MASGAAADRDTETGVAILFELDVARIARLDRPPSRWTARVIALFTALTCLGLGAMVVQPWSIGLSLSQQAAGPGQPGAPWGPTPSGTAAAIDRPLPPRLNPVLATVRVATVEVGARIVQVAGQAAVTVPVLDVTLAVAGRIVGEATVAVPSEATLIAPWGTSGVGAAPWSVDLALPPFGQAEMRDGVATVEVRWPASPAGPAGSQVMVVGLGDGRGH